MRALDLNRFIQIRRPRWQRLESLLDRVEQRGLEALPRDDVDELYALYRHASSDLNWAQTQTGNPALLDYLEVTVGRAYGLLAPPARAKPFRAWWQMVRHGLPAVVRANVWMFLLSAGIFLAGGLFGGAATAVDPDLVRIFLPAEHLTETPSERVADLEQRERDGNPRIDGQGFLLFSMFLFSHNIRVCIFAFALGLTFGIGTAIVLFFNGTILGCIAYRYFDEGVGEFFVAWVGPHAAIELPCIVFAGMAGLMIGRAQWRKDGNSAWHRLAAMRRPLLTVVVATASWLVVAGWIEGGFSQINEPTLPYPLKIAVAAVLFVGLMAYLFVVPVRKEAGQPASDQLS
ncbi:MAG: stage II sporulation protein M [Planctomycetota bacterium]